VLISGTSLKIPNVRMHAKVILFRIIAAVYREAAERSLSIPVEMGLLSRRITG